LAKFTNTGGRKLKGLNKIDKLAKVKYTGGRNPKGLNKIDKLAKVTYTGGRKPKGLNNIDKLPKVTYAGGRKPKLRSKETPTHGHRNWVKLPFLLEFRCGWHIYLEADIVQLTKGIF
jgi:hypothetical protein